MHQVHTAEGYLTEEVNFTKDVYRNPNSSYQPKNVGYPNWDTYTKGERGPPTNHGYQPYLSPNYQEPRQAPPANNDDLRRHMLEISKHNDQRLDVIQQAQAEDSRVIKGQIRGVNAHLADLEEWKKGVDSRLAALAASVPRPTNRLPGQGLQSTFGVDVSSLGERGEG